MPTYSIEYDPGNKWPYWIRKDGYLIRGDCSARSLREAKKMIKKDVDYPEPRIVYEVTYN